MMVHLRFSGSICLLALTLCLALPATAQRQMEALGRGVVAVPADDGVFISWRLLGTEPRDLAFNVYRTLQGEPARKLNDQPLTGPTHFVDGNPARNRDAAYSVRAVVDGQEQPASHPFVLTADASDRPYISVPLKTPEGYSPNDASVADLDGDGEYEIVLHQTGRSHDNSHSGPTDPPILQAYELDGTLLWEINLGPNIREGAHYTQFMVYDLDGDGFAEMVVKTADGTVDGRGRVLGDADANYVNDAGRVLAGPEYLTIFDGRTGAAIDTTVYIPRRGLDTFNPTSDQMKAIWGDGYGNRQDRFLAGVAYLDGEHPSVVMARGYYTRTFLVAWDFRDGKLRRRWVFDSGQPGLADYSGQGNHSLSVADVDQDGRDEIVYGSMTVDDDGTGLYTTQLHHGDALHVSDMDPTHPGLEVFMPHESASRNGNVGASFREAKTGKILWSSYGEGDVGRGMAADIDPRHVGYEAWASNDRTLYSAKGEKIGARPGSIDSAVWWDGDLLRELLDHRGERGEWHGVVYKWDWEDQEQRILWEDPQTRSNNYTKGNPVLSGDILGDWREEMIWRTEAGDELRVYTTTIPTEYRFRTFMHDPQYRLAIAWQNVAYNQPPHPGFYVGAGMGEPPTPQIHMVIPATRHASQHTALEPRP